MSHRSAGRRLRHPLNRRNRSDALLLRFARIATACLVAGCASGGHGTVAAGSVARSEASVWRAARERLGDRVEPRRNPAAPNVAYVGGRWYEPSDGGRFVPRDTVYAAGGVFVDRRPARLDSVVSLANTFVVPPFGDVHTHHFDNPGLIGPLTEHYRAEGIFYAASLTNSPRGRAAVAARVNRPDGLDVAYADAGLTSTGGHPAFLYEVLALNYRDPAVQRERVLEIVNSRRSDAYVLLDSAPELDRAWAQYTASRPDLLKVYLLDSEHHRAAARWPVVRAGQKGLDPALVPELVRRAHAANIRVAAHVETAYDFGVAARAGVDLFAHLPGYGLGRDDDPGRYTLRDEDVRAAAAHGAVVNATVYRSEGYAGTDSDRLARVRALQARNIAALRRAGVRIVAGADAYTESSANEVAALRRLGVFSNADLLAMWAVDTPRAIFPARAIGALRPWYEANFLALACDPLADFACTAKITRRVKQGEAW